VNGYGKEYEDEHYTSMVFNLLDKVYFGNKFIKRNWTSLTYSNTDGTEPEYNVLHLPAEKNGFFATKFAEL
jgi:hypothetical protein